MAEIKMLAMVHCHLEFGILFEIFYVVGKFLKVYVCLVTFLLGAMNFHNLSQSTLALLEQGIDPDFSSYPQDQLSILEST